MAANRTARTTRSTSAAATKTVEPTTPAPDTTPATPEAESTEEGTTTVALSHSHLVSKDPSEMHRDYAAWLQEVTGVEMDEAAIKVIQFVHATKMEYQKSDRNQALLAGRKQAWAKDRAAKAKADAKAKRAKLVKLAADLGLKVSDLEGVDPAQAAKVAKQA